MDAEKQNQVLLKSGDADITKLLEEIQCYTHVLIPDLIKSQDPKYASFQMDFLRRVGKKEAYAQQMYQDLITSQIPTQEAYQFEKCYFLEAESASTSSPLYLLRGTKNGIKEIYQMTLRNPEDDTSALMLGYNSHVHAIIQDAKRQSLDKIAPFTIDGIAYQILPKDPGEEYGCGEQKVIVFQRYNELQHPIKNNNYSKDIRISKTLSGAIEVFSNVVMRYCKVVPVTQSQFSYQHAYYGIKQEKAEFLTDHTK